VHPFGYWRDPFEYVPSFADNEVRTVLKMAYLGPRPEVKGGCDMEGSSEEVISPERADLTKLRHA
jgi:hypothetical protein